MPDNRFDFPELPPRHGPRFRIHGLAVAAVVHLLAAMGLMVASARPWYYESWAAREARVLYVTASGQHSEDRLQDEPRIVTVPSEVTGPMLQEKIDQLAEESRNRTDQENLDRLNQLAERLEEVSSEQSIERMAGVFQTLTGTKPRAQRPSQEPVAGEFDFDTAQFHDVRREETDEGSWRYLCILVDAEGRAVEVEMDASDGQRVYQTMLRIKENPLLEQVYRQIAMPLFDKMLAGARQAARAGMSGTSDSETESASEDQQEPARLESGTEMQASGREEPSP